MLKFKKDFQFLNDWKKKVVLLYNTGEITVDTGGLFGGSWSPASGGGFGGEGIARACYKEDFVMGDLAETYLSVQSEMPEKIGFCHAPGAMQTWPWGEVFDII